MPRERKMIRENEIWNIVPPEEKLELLARAQVSGITTATIMCAVSFTLAIALKIQWLIWISLCASPLVFQTGASRAWRGLKPKVMLEYLAARSVARRFAYAANSQALDLELLFRGKVSEVKEGESSQLSDAISSIESAADEATVWIGLLKDSVVAFRESQGGGVLEFVSITDKRIEVSAKNQDDSKKDYSSNREILIKFNESFGKSNAFRITSDYPVALNVLEKKLIARVEHSKKASAEITKPKATKNNKNDESLFSWNLDG